MNSCAATCACSLRVIAVKFVKANARKPIHRFPPIVPNRNTALIDILLYDTFTSLYKSSLASLVTPTSPVP